MAETPKICGRRSFSTVLEKGKDYYWCSCGMSKNQPWCDGSHRGSGFSPVTFTAEKSEKHYLCLCKRTGTPPFCDGAHKVIPAEELDVALNESDQI